MESSLSNALRIHGYSFNNWTIYHILSLILIIAIIIIRRSTCRICCRLRDKCREVLLKIQCGWVISLYLYYFVLSILFYSLFLQNISVRLIWCEISWILPYLLASLGLGVGIREIFLHVWKRTHNGYIASVVTGMLCDGAHTLK